MEEPRLENFNVSEVDIEWHQRINTKIQNYNDSFWTIEALKESQAAGSAIGLCIMVFPLIPIFIIIFVYNEYSYSKVKRITDTPRWGNAQRYLDAVSKYTAFVDAIVSDYADFIHEHYRIDRIWDVSKLPHPKEKIMEALIHLHVRETTSEKKRKAIAVLFINLSQFQEGVGGEVLSPASALLKLHKDLDEDLESGEIDDVQFQKLLQEGLAELEKKRELYDERNKLVMKEMNEILPKRFLQGTAKILMERSGKK